MRAASFVLTSGLICLSAEARAADPPEGWKFAGQAQPAAAAVVKARVTGFVTRVAVETGEKVAPADLLIEFERSEYRLALDAALARVEVAKAGLQIARTKAAHDKSLLERKVLGTDEADLSAAAQTEAEARLRLAKVEAERAQLILSRTNVTAPISGRVSRLQIAKGDLVVAERTPILTVVSTDPLRVDFNVPEAVLLQLRRDGLADPAKLNVTVGFAGEEGFPHTATMESIEPEVNIKTGSVRFHAIVSNPKGLFSPGMSARVLLVPRSK